MINGYSFYDSKQAVSPEELANLYRFTRWARSRSLEDIGRMLAGTSMCFSVRHQDQLVAFCRIITDFVYRASLWDIMVHPEHQGKNQGDSSRHHLYERTRTLPRPQGLLHPRRGPHAPAKTH